MKAFILGALLAVLGGIYYLKFYKVPKVAIPSLPPVVLASTLTPRPTQVKTKMYRWVDENGVKQFSQSPPRDARIRAEVVEIVSQAAPKNPGLMYSKELKGRSLGSRPSQRSKMIRSARQPSSSACMSAKRMLRRIRTQSYTNRNVHLQRVARHKGRVKRAC